MQLPGKAVAVCTTVAAVLGAVELAVLALLGVCGISNFNVLDIAHGIYFLSLVNVYQIVAQTNLCAGIVIRLRQHGDGRCQARIHRRHCSSR